MGFRTWAPLVAAILASSCRHTTERRTPVRGTDGGSAVRFALLQNSYWGGGIDRPLFLAYADGTILFPRERSRSIPIQYFVLRLTSAGVDSVLRELGVSSALYSLDSAYDFAPSVTDQHSFYAVLPQDSGMKVITIRAGLADSENLKPAVPEPFKRLYANLLGFHPPGAIPWRPDSLQVSIWPYEYAPDNPPLRWPATWPGLENPRWHRRPDPYVEEVRTIRFPFSYSGAIDSILSAQRTKQAVGISGKKWAMGYRWIFPHEDEWWWLARRLES